MIDAELALVNAAAAASLVEGLEETLTLHRLDRFRRPGLTFKMTNLIGSNDARTASRPAKVDDSRTSDQKQRWLATAVLDLEPYLCRIRGHQPLPLVRQALQASVSRGEVAA